MSIQVSTRNGVTTDLQFNGPKVSCESEREETKQKRNLATVVTENSRGRLQQMGRRLQNNNGTI